MTESYTDALIQQKEGPLVPPGVVMADCLTALVTFYASELLPAACLLVNRAKHLDLRHDGDVFEILRRRDARPLVRGALKRSSGDTGAIKVERHNVNAPTEPPYVTMGTPGDGSVVATFTSGVHPVPSLTVEFSPAAHVEGVPVDGFSWGEVFSWVAIGGPLPACLLDAVDSLTRSLHRYDTTEPDGVDRGVTRMHEVWRTFDALLAEVVDHWPRFERWSVCDGWLGVRDRVTGAAIVVGRTLDDLGPTAIKVWSGDASPGGNFEARKPTALAIYRRESLRVRGFDFAPRVVLATAFVDLAKRRAQACR